MARVERTIDAPPERIFAVLADGWTYSDFVVGTAHIRDVDDAWPATGSALHHKVGPWPLSIRDTSTVLACEPPHLLLLKVRIWPLGEGRVRFTLAPVGTRATRVTLREEFPGGPLLGLRTKVNDLALHARNVETLRRLGDLATRRAPARDARPGLRRAMATSSQVGQADDATGGEAGPESAFGDEPFQADADLDAVGDARADGAPSAREFDAELRDPAGGDPDPDSAAGRALRPSPQGRIGPV